MFRQFVCRYLMPIVVLVAVSRVGSTQTPKEHAEVETLLKQWKATNLITDTQFAPLKRMGDRALPLLAGFLRDAELGPYAEMAMQQIDSIGATPYLLKVLPNRDGNTRQHTFRSANRAMMEYDWFVRQGQPKPDPNKPAPRYPGNTKPYPYRREIREAALQILKQADDRGGEREVLLAVGLSGNMSDLPLLRNYIQKNGGRFRVFAIAAMARLGDGKALDEIAAELQKSIHPQPAEAFSTDTGQRIEPKPGQVVTPLEEGNQFRDIAFEAGFSMNRRFVPLLARHLDDPPGQRHGDYSDPSPYQNTADALSQIVDGREYSIRDWKQWWQAQPGSHFSEAKRQ